MVLMKEKLSWSHRVETAFARVATCPTKHAQPTYKLSEWYHVFIFMTFSRGSTYENAMKIKAIGTWKNDSSYSFHGHTLLHFLSIYMEM